MSQLKPDYTFAILSIGNNTEDLRVIKLVAEVLANASNYRAWISKSSDEIAGMYSISIITPFTLLFNYIFH